MAKLDNGTLLLITNFRELFVSENMLMGDPEEVPISLPPPAWINHCTHTSPHRVLLVDPPPPPSPPLHISENMLMEDPEEGPIYPLLPGSITVPILFPTGFFQLNPPPPQQTHTHTHTHTHTLLLVYTFLKLWLLGLPPSPPLQNFQ